MMFFFFSNLLNQLVSINIDVSNIYYFYGTLIKKYISTGSRTILIGLVIPFQIAPIIYIHKLDNQVQKSTENTTILTQ